MILAKCLRSGIRLMSTNCIVANPARTPANPAVIFGVRGYVHPCTHPAQNAGFHHALHFPARVVAVAAAPSETRLRDGILFEPACISS